MKFRSVSSEVYFSKRFVWYLSFKRFVWIIFKSFVWDVCFKCFLWCLSSYLFHLKFMFVLHFVWSSMHTLFILKRFSSIRLVFFGGIRVVHLFSFMCCVVLLCFIYLRHACYAQYCLCLWIVHSYLPIRFSLSFI